MGVARDLFFMESSNVQSLHRRITPTEFEIQHLQERWNHLADFLKDYFDSVTEMPTRTWLQGSYKFGVIVRPLYKGDEYDVDLGLYFVCPLRDLSQCPSNKEIKGWVQNALLDYQEQNNDVIGVLTPAKERCARISFSNGLHVDVPVYLLDQSSDRRVLATETHGYEDSDPKAIYLWFKAQVANPERRQVRRVVRYVKAWCGLVRKYKKIETLSSVTITVLAAGSYLSISNEADGDDEVFVRTCTAMMASLNATSVVQNPVSKRENLNRLDNGALATFLRELKFVIEIGEKALACSDSLAAANYWTEIFAHFFPLPADSGGELKTGQSTALVIPKPMVKVVVKVTESGQPTRDIGTFDGDKLLVVFKGYSLWFLVANASVYPVHAEIKWIVRTSGGEAESVSDLGHISSSSLTVPNYETTKYAGLQFMDCLICVNSRVIAQQRTRVEIRNAHLPKRVVPKRRFVR
jgi:hypothetical protein